MADTGTIARAYVQVMPSTKGIKNALTTEFSGSMGAAGTAGGKSFVSSFKKTIAGAGLGLAVGKLFKSAFSEGGALQQSYIGGLETIYGEAQDQIRGYAKEAVKYGISMNDYSQQAVSFGAALKASFGGDVKAAAESANMAITDMADNQAKMGTDIGALQYAYQGFAKQNYTMLDNLKLGYGGTKTEMERLLSDAEKLTGIHYDISNLGDVYSAIHVIQGELGLTGTAATEAGQTFTGSFSAVKAAWENLMGNIALGQDVTDSLTVLIGNVTTFLIDNVAPMLEQIGKSLVQVAIALKPYVMEFLGKIPGWIAEKLPEMITGIGSLIDTLISGLTGQTSTIGATLAEGINTVLAGFVDLVQRLIDGWNSLSPGMQEFIQTVGEIILVAAPIFGVVGKIMPIFTKIGGGLMGLGTTITELGGGIKGFSTLVMAVGKGLLSFLWPAGVIAGVIAAIVVLWTKCEWFRDGVKAVVGAITGFVKGAIEKVKAFFQDIQDAITTMHTVIAKILNKIKGAFTTVFNGIKSFLSPIINWFKGIFDFKWELPKIKLPHFSIEGKFSLTPPSVPHLAVKWYKKAMDTAYVLDQPTIFGAAGGSYLGAGESGREIVAGEAHLLSMIRDVVQAKPGGAVINNNFTIVASPDMDKKALAEEVKDVLVASLERERITFA